VHTSESAKSLSGHANTAKVRHLNALRIADHYVFDVTLPIDQGTYLPISFVRELRQLACELLSDDLMRRDATLIELFDAPDLIWF
jgi:hypothetical protein